MSSNPYWELWLKSTLVTLPEWGIGYYHPHIPLTHVYDRGYLEEYQRRASTEIGHQLNEARVDLVRRYEVDADDLIDIGVGAGNFVQAYECWGYDINPHAVSILKSIDRYIEPKDLRGQVSMTFWDSLEHIPDPKPLLDLITQYAFVSTPIYPGVNHITRSKHYKPNEHVWYFTHHGLDAFMKAHGFVMLEKNHMETELGREAINTYVFGRAYAPAVG